MDGRTLKVVSIIAMVSGVLSAIFYLLHDVVGAMNYPGYDFMRQAVSDLTATDAPSFAIASGISSVYGIFSCLCCVLLCLMFMEKRKSIWIGIILFTVMQFVSAIGYSLFPLSSSGYDGSIQSFMHVYVITIAVVLLSILSLTFIAVGGFKDKRKVLGTASAIAFLCMMFGAMGSSMLPQDVFGIVERFSTYGAVVFTGFLGVYGYITMMKQCPASS